MVGRAATTPHSLTSVPFWTLQRRLGVLLMADKTSVRMLCPGNLGQRITLHLPEFDVSGELMMADRHVQSQPAWRFFNGTV